VYVHVFWCTLYLGARGLPKHEIFSAQKKIQLELKHISILPLIPPSLPAFSRYLRLPRRSQPLDAVNTVDFHPTSIYHRWIW
jgi:hypothetical protein